MLVPLLRFSPRERGKCAGTAGFGSDINRFGTSLSRQAVSIVADIPSTVSVGSADAVSKTQMNSPVAPSRVPSDRGISPHYHGGILMLRRTILALCCALGVSLLLFAGEARAQQAFGRQWGSS